MSILARQTDPRRGRLHVLEPRADGSYDWPPCAECSAVLEHDDRAPWSLHCACGAVWALAIDPAAPPAAEGSPRRRSSG
jgi:hypothetical protein